MTRRRLIQGAVLLVLGIIVLAGLIRAVNPNDVAHALEGASPGWIALGILGPIAFVILRGLRWKVILDASSPHAALGDVTAITGVGFAVNAVGAFKLGDLLRLGMMGQRARIGMGEVGATIVVERVLDVLALLVIAIATAAASGAGGRGAQLWGGVIAFAIVSAGIGLLGAMLVVREAAAARLWTRVTARLPARFRDSATDLGVSALRGLRSLTSGGHLAVAAGLSLLIWIASTLGLYALYRSVGPPLPFFTVFLALSLFTISQAVSITPGSVGTFEGFYFLVLTAFGASRPAAVAAAAVISHLGGIVGLALCGVAGSVWLRVHPPVTPVRLQGTLAREDGA